MRDSNCFELIHAYLCEPMNIKSMKLLNIYISPTKFYNLIFILFILDL